MKTSTAVELVSVSHFFRILDPESGDLRTVNAISDVSLELPEREFVSVIGPSGCGKTTLLNLMAGLEPVQIGKVRLAGSSPRAGRSDVAYMLARDALLPWRTVESNAAFGLQVRGLAEAKTKQVVNGLLDLVGLRAFAHAKPRQLSQGMRQRVALARTFALPSSILLMDEPFGALDAQTKQQLQELLLQLWEQDRRTVVLVTHDLHEAIALSDRVVVMSSRPGRIKEVFKVSLPRPRSLAELIVDPSFVDLYRQIRSLVEEISQ